MPQIGRFPLPKGKKPAKVRCFYEMRRSGLRFFQSGLISLDGIGNSIGCQVCIHGTVIH